MQIAQSRKQVRISKPRALEQDRFNTKGDELLPDAPSYWKVSCIPALAHQHQALDGSYCICQSWRRGCAGPASSIPEIVGFRIQESNPLDYPSSLPLYPIPFQGTCPRSNLDIPLERKGIWLTSM